MKRFLSILCLLIVTASVLSQEVDRAELAYRNGNYSAAIDLYESALLDGNKQANIYYNLASAYYMNSEIGEAVLNYRRAQMLMPRNPAIVEQLQRARQERVDGIYGEVDWLVVMHNLTAEYLTLTETIVIASVVWTLFFLALAIGINRKGWAVILSVTGVVMIIAVSLLSARMYVATWRPPAVVISESVQAMSGPGEDYLPLFVLYEAVELRVLDDRNGWLRIVLPDGRQGWIRASSLAYIPN